MRRSLIVFGAVSVLAVAALVAAAIITFDLYGGGRSSRPRAVLEPYGTAPAATSTAVPVSGTVNGSAATSTGPLSAGATPKASAPVGAVVSTASASGVAVGAGAGAPTATASAAPVDTATATATPSLVDLCRSVVAAGNGWPSVLKSSDRSTVIAAAGTKKNVLPYCTALLAGTNTG